mmetsp:Transcript_58652/g.132171  ORF Transcript_58652/g.132171 Transcript_58652/m.132171 type:complete len:276 (-) Transcript_58652:58-885(-)
MILCDSLRLPPRPPPLGVLVRAAAQQLRVALGLARGRVRRQPHLVSDLLLHPAIDLVCELLEPIGVSRKVDLLLVDILDLGHKGGAEDPEALAPVDIRHCLAHGDTVRYVLVHPAKYSRREELDLGVGRRLKVLKEACQASEERGHHDEKLRSVYGSTAVEVVDAEEEGRPGHHVLVGHHHHGAYDLQKVDPAILWQELAEGGLRQRPTFKPQNLPELAQGDGHGGRGPEMLKGGAQLLPLPAPQPLEGTLHLGQLLPPQLARRVPHGAGGRGAG